FRWLGAKHWIDRASRELRASGVSVAAAPRPLLDLTPQQRQIVVLAAQGLTNREIAERLYLSPRTVSSHLYRSFPRLGITTRSQLRDVIGGSVSPELVQMPLGIPTNLHFVGADPSELAWTSTVARYSPLN